MCTWKSRNHYLMERKKGQKGLETLLSHNWREWESTNQHLKTAAYMGKGKPLSNVKNNGVTCNLTMAGTTPQATKKFKDN